MLPPRFEDEIFKKFVMSISNIKTAESIKLMKFLYQRRNPKDIELTYESYTYRLYKDRHKQYQEDLAIRKANTV